MKVVWLYFVNIGSLKVMTFIKPINLNIYKVVLNVCYEDNNVLMYKY